MRAPTEILGVRYFLLGVIFTGPIQEWSLATRALLRTRTRVLPFISRLPEPLGQVCIYYFRGCQCLWARPLHSHHILLRGYRLLVPYRPGLITYCIRVQSPLYPIYTAHYIYPDSSRMRRQLSSHFCPGIQQGFIPLSVCSADTSELCKY